MDAASWSNSLKRSTYIWSNYNKYQYQDKVSHVAVVENSQRTIVDLYDINLSVFEC